MLFGRQGPVVCCRPQPLRLLESGLDVPVRQELQLLAPLHRRLAHRLVALDHLGRPGPREVRPRAGLFFTKHDPFFVL